MIPQEIAQTIIDPKAYADGARVDDAFARLRKDMPFAQAHPEGFDPFWVVTKHADILACCHVFLKYPIGILDRLFPFTKLH